MSLNDRLAPENYQCWRRCACRNTRAPVHALAPSAPTPLCEQAQKTGVCMQSYTDSTVPMMFCFSTHCTVTTGSSETLSQGPASSNHAAGCEHPRYQEPKALTRNGS